MVKLANCKKIRSKLLKPANVVSSYEAPMFRGR
jgi:hypothetical protein